jgi:hypothetical protein
MRRLRRAKLANLHSGFSDDLALDSLQPVLYLFVIRRLFSLGASGASGASVRVGRERRVRRCGVGAYACGVAVPGV